MNEPVRVEGSGEIGLAPQDPLPFEAARFPVREGLAEAFDGDEPVPEEGLHGRPRSVGRVVVQEIDGYALIDEIADDLPDDVGFVVRRENRHDPELGRQAHDSGFYGKSMRAQARASPLDRQYRFQLNVPSIGWPVT